MSEWREYTLGDVCEITSSKRIFAHEYRTFGVPFYRGKEIIEKQSGNAISTELFIEESRFREIKDKFACPQKGDILLTSVGTLGIPYVVQDERFYFKDGNLTWFRNYNGITCEFLYYWFLSPIGKNQIETRSIGSTQRALTIDGLLKFDIFIPSLPTQRAIAEVLSSLDDKIDLLTRQNATLEALAQTYFRQWFVEEAGENWKEYLFGDLVRVKYGKDHKHLKEGNIPVYGSGGIMRYADTSLYNNESVLIPRKGTLNNVIYVNWPFWSVDTMFYTEMKHDNLAKFIYFFVRDLDLPSMNVGSAVPSMTADVLNNLLLRKPPIELLRKFEECVAAPLFYKIERNNTQISTLQKLRDTLLPKLISGEVRVK